MTAALHFTRQARQIGRKLVGRRAADYLHRFFHRPHPAAEFYRSAVQGKFGIEIGGPSSILEDAGDLPLYNALAGLDNCLYSPRTIWTGEVQEGRTFRYHPLKPSGTQFICEATDLKHTKDCTYEFLLASHCLEHVANPLRALAEWRRVLQEVGFLLLILPHKDGTFDWRRPVTPLSHMIEDFNRGVGEDDLTHLPEILALHDIEKDRAAGTRQQFQLRCQQNYSNRAMHHHVFDSRSAVALVDHAAFQVVRVDTAKPYHIMILARRCDRTRDNSAFLGPAADYTRLSFFPSDRSRRTSRG